VHAPPPKYATDALDVSFVRKVSLYQALEAIVNKTIAIPHVLLQYAVINSHCVCLVSVRLRGESELPNAGILEIYYNGSWGTVCEDYFDYRDRDVACHMLGFG